MDYLSSFTVVHCARIDTECNFEALQFYNICMQMMHMRLDDTTVLNENSCFSVNNENTVPGEYMYVLAHVGKYAGNCLVFTSALLVAFSGIENLWYIWRLAIISSTIRTC